MEASWGRGKLTFPPSASTSLGPDLTSPVFRPGISAGGRELIEAHDTALWGNSTA